jgi:hypothetical protein
MTLPRLAVYVVFFASGQCWISASLAFDTTGSLIKFPDNAEFKDTDEKPVCIPAGTIVKVIGSSADVVKVKIVEVGKDPSSNCNNPPKEPEYKIASTELAKHDYMRRGLSYGTLVVPFKFQLHDHSLQQGVTLGGYLGFQTPFPAGRWDHPYNFTWTPLLFAGGSWASAAQTQPNGSATNSNQLGISYGAGTFFTINNSYQLGVILGWDRLGSNASPAYKYEGKPWLSFAIGWNFAR